MNDEFDSDSEMPQQQASDTAAAPASTMKSGTGGLKSFFKVPEPKKSIATKRMHAGGATEASGCEDRAGAGMETCSSVYLVPVHRSNNSTT